ncbi:hypothetical protein AAF712_016881, partial [Marasmius tenuissimus]
CSHAPPSARAKAHCCMEKKKQPDGETGMPTATPLVAGPAKKKRKTIQDTLDNVVDFGMTESGQKRADIKFLRCGAT